MNFVRLPHPGPAAVACFTSPRTASLIVAAVLGAWSLPGRADNPTEAVELATVNVIGTTPLPGLGTDISDVSANVQTFDAEEMARQHPTNISEFLEANPTSITINSSQGNPYQPDVYFRGFTASPVLGTPQGLSVFVDGVRVNEPFGDVVNWDLIPQSAISSIQIIPGSNPAFGLNTLGGALGIYTKSGSQYPGGSIETYAGSWGRSGTEVEYGGKKDNLDYFFTGNIMGDNGWADHNPSQVQQFFGKVGWQDDRTDLDLTINTAHNTLQGTQTIPLSFYAVNPRQAYTWPDSNQNDLTAITLKGSHYLQDDVILGGNAYYRYYKNTNFSSNVNSNYDPTDPTSPQATNDISVINQESYGGGLQLTVQGHLADMDNQFSTGVTADLGHARFTQIEQTAMFTPDRGTVGTSAYAQITDASTTNSYYGAYLTDTLKVTPQWTLTGSGRFNLARVTVADESGQAPGLNGDHTFTRFNPAVGVNFNPVKDFTAYGTYNEGSRAPTPIELTCADPSAPCKLPNNFVSDPDLKQVVSRTWEAGLRGKIDASTVWNAAVFRTELDDDIQFISAGAVSTNSGYFQNVGTTLRQGFEAGVTTHWGSFTGSLHYAYVNATFQSAFTVNSPANSSADANGNIQVTPGDRIPGIPLQNLKLRLQYDYGQKATLGVNVIVNSNVYARGDENNQDVNGPVSGYTVVNLDGRYEFEKDWEVFARIVNLFNTQYANFGILGQNYFNGPGGTFNGSNPSNEQFVGAGAPLGAWIGVRYSWR